MTLVKSLSLVTFFVETKKVTHRQAKKTSFKNQIKSKKTKTKPTNKAESHPHQGYTKAHPQDYNHPPEHHAS